MNIIRKKRTRRERTEYKQAERRAGEGLRPGDDYNERGDVESVLLNHGWQVARRAGSTVFLRKPGKRGRGHQATLHAVAHNVFFCFSTSAPPFDDLRGYSAFQVYAMLEHNGDFSAAAKALSALGYGTPIENSEPTAGAAQVSTQARQELTGREQIICRMFADAGITDESFRTYIAVRAIANGRKTFKLSGAIVARHIRIEKDYDTDRNFGWKRIDRLKTELKRAFSVPIFTRIRRAVYNPDPGKKTIPATYSLDESIFDEAERVAVEHPNMQSGQAFIPGKAREEAAISTGAKYRISENAPAEKKPELSNFQKLRNAEKRWEDALKMIAELMEDEGEPTLEFQNKAAAYKVKVDEILLKHKRKARRKKQSQTGQKSYDFLAVNDTSETNKPGSVVASRQLRGNATEFEPKNEPPEVEIGATYSSEDSWVASPKNNPLDTEAPPIPPAEETIIQEQEVDDYLDSQISWGEDVLADMSPVPPIRADEEMNADK